jgi:hypothetical protein
VVQGGYGRGAGIPLHQRLRADQLGVPQPMPDPPPLKPCWVSDRYGRLPGLLLGWRRMGDEWQGRVVRAVLDPDGGWVVVEEWIPSVFLEPA